MSRNNTINYSLNRENSPCNGCTREMKCPGCHDRCKAFKDWKASGDKNKAAKLQYELRRGYK